MQVRLLRNLGQRDALRFGLAVGHAELVNVPADTAADLIRLGWAVAVPGAEESQAPTLTPDTEPRDAEPEDDEPDDSELEDIEPEDAEPDDTEPRDAEPEAEPREPIETPARVDLTTLPPRPQTHQKSNRKRRRR